MLLETYGKPVLGVRDELVGAARLRAEGGELRKKRPILCQRSKLRREV